LTCVKARLPVQDDGRYQPEALAMIYNTILVQLDIDAAAAPRLTFAWNLARRFEADMIAFCAAEPHLTVPGDFDGSVSIEAMQIQCADIEERLKVLKLEFEDLVKDSNRASWRGMIGDPTKLLACHARAADLLVAGTDNTGESRLRTVNPGELVLSAGRPVLFPNERCEPLTGENILVAWKDTREARRAVVDAMPFLVGAREVLVAAVEDDDKFAVRESVAEVVRFLMRHGVKARSKVIDASDRQAPEALLKEATDCDSDLTVSGGYGHSRLREWIFGGVTRTLLKNCSMSRLMTN
jgi:nucleotide-binding universal stress UspA family protein